MSRRLSAGSQICAWSWFAVEMTISLVPFSESHSCPTDCAMDNLITVITRFQLPAGVTADQIRAAFEEAAPRFRNVPGLIRKQFLHSQDCRTGGGVYLCNDEPAARAFMNDARRTNDSREVSGRSRHRILRFACDCGELNAKPQHLPLTGLSETHKPQNARCVLDLFLGEKL